MAIERCPVCHGPAEVDVGQLAGAKVYQATITTESLVQSLGNERVVLAVARALTLEQRLALGRILLLNYFTLQDVKDEGEATARCAQVALQARKHHNHADVEHFGELAARHKARARRMIALLGEDDYKKALALVAAGDPPPDAGPAGSGGRPQLVKP